MIPKVSHKEITSPEKTVSLGSVTGGKKTVQGSFPWIDNASFKEALIASLERSRIFKEVAIERPSDYVIAAEIISQKMSGSVDNTIDFFVHYELMEIKSSSTIWKGNIYSHYELSVKDIYEGNKRRRRLQELAVRDNLGQLLGQLGRILSEK